MISYGEDRYKPALKAMWKRCFPADSHTFVDYYFANVCKNEETLLYIIDNQPVSSMQIIPYSLKNGEELSKAGYISGAMTKPDYQGRGYMQTLINAAFGEMQKQKYDYVFLIPQQQSLFDFYARFGFKTFTPDLSKNTVILKTKEQLAHISWDMENCVNKDKELSHSGLTGMIKTLNPEKKDIERLFVNQMLE